MKKILIIVSVILCGQLYAQNTQDTLKRAFAVQIGNGITYGGLGALVEYQMPLRDNFWITPYIGLGGSLGGTDSTTAEYFWLCNTIGVNFEHGKKHRLIIGPQLISCFDVKNKPDTAIIYKKTLIGPSIISGYKGMASFGLMWQVTLGMAFIQNPIVADKKYFFQPHVNIGVGYRF